MVCSSADTVPSPTPPLRFPEEISQQSFDLTLAQVVLPTQGCHHCHHPWPKGTPGGIRRSFGAGTGSTRRACPVKHLILDGLCHGRRNLGHLMSQRGSFSPFKGMTTLLAG